MEGGDLGAADPQKVKVVGSVVVAIDDHMLPLLTRARRTSASSQANGPQIGWPTLFSSLSVRGFRGVIEGVSSSEGAPTLTLGCAATS